MKKNIGYRLGRLYRKFMRWQHPTALKWLYVIAVTALVCYFLSVFVLIAGVIAAFWLSNTKPSDFSLLKIYSHSGYTPDWGTGYYKNGEINWDDPIWYDDNEV
ncbi:hypothetical protein ACWA5Z_10175 [Testudinibacter sp. P80/BLE/0925]|uniref:hypothetical protein n=1 Tax=Testudinibacter sp. TW-1 TaxID=3417757 RepID=UPI003D35ADB7